MVTILAVSVLASPLPTFASAGSHASMSSAMRPFILATSSGVQNCGSTTTPSRVNVSNVSAQAKVLITATLEKGSPRDRGTLHTRGRNAFGRHVVVVRAFRSHQVLRSKRAKTFLPKEAPCNKPLLPLFRFFLLARWHLMGRVGRRGGNLDMVTMERCTNSWARYAHRACCACAQAGSRCSEGGNSGSDVRAATRAIDVLK